MNKLLPLLVFSALLLVPLVAQDAFAVTKTYVGVDGGNWELGTNWSPAGVPAPNDDVIFDGSDVDVEINSAVTVGPLGSITQSPTGNNSNLEVNGPSGSLTIFGTFTMNDVDDDIILRNSGGTITVQCSGVVTLGNGMIFVTLSAGAGTLVNHGTITGTANDAIVISSLGLVQNSGTLPAGIINNAGGTLQTIPSICIVGGEFLSIDSTALLLAGAQSFSWMIPVVLSVLGIGMFVVSRKSENS